MSPFTEAFTEWFEQEKGSKPNPIDPDHLALSAAFEAGWDWGISSYQGSFDPPRDSDS